MRFLHERFRPTTTPLHRVVAHAYQNNAMYRRKFDDAKVAAHDINSNADLARLPTTTREEVAGDPWVLLCVPRVNLVQAHMSTGTTGKKSVYVAYDWEDLYDRGLKPLQADGSATKLLRIEPGEIVFNALPYEVSVTGMAVHRSVQDGLGACIVPLGKGGFYSEPRKTLKIMKEIQGDHLFTTPSYAAFLGQLASDMGMTSREVSPLRALWLIGELCSNALRRRIEALWGCPAYLYYGSMEAGVIGVECGEQDGYHMATNFTATEVIEKIPKDPASRRSAPGTGEIVVTTLWRYATPLIRYETGDLGSWERAPCRCGLAGDRLRLAGRFEDALIIAGRVINVLEIEEGLLAIPAVDTFFQLRADGTRLTVVLPHDPSKGAVGPIADSIVSWLQQNLQIECRVETVLRGSYAGGKFLRVLNILKS